MASPGRLWRTLRWLKREQVIGRLRFRLARPQPDLSLAPTLRAAAGPWHPPAARAPSLVGPTQLSLLHQTHDITQVGWDSATLPLLWRYHQHYFDDLNAEDHDARRDWQVALVNRWIADNPPARGTGWAPYPVSLRVVNWVKWWFAGQTPDAAWLHSLAVQARWLERRLEWHLLGNHLFVNAKALVYAGLWFDGAEAERWLATGLGILDRELPEQILDDGGQFERSPMYHALALEDVLDLVNVIQARAPSASSARALLPALKQRAPAMLHWLRCMTHPSGALARFNDSSDGIAQPGPELERYAALLGVSAAPPPREGVHALAASGYVRVARGTAAALLDVAPVGPDYLPGHAHADTLSFELSVGGRELIVNRGTSVYGTGARRLVERGTAAHSTLQVGHRDSSEVWSGFRVGRRARVHGPAIDGWRIAAHHDGYAHLAGAPRHRRCWTFEDGSLLIEDDIAAREPALSRLHLAPGLSADEVGPGHWRIAEAARVHALIAVEAGQACIEAWQHAQGFGVLAPAQTLAIALVDGRCRVRIRWSL
jgi:uncharacterized heparinase superfamily protein